MKTGTENYITTYFQNNGLLVQRKYYFPLLIEILMIIIAVFLLSINYCHIFSKEKINGLNNVF